MAACIKDPRAPDQITHTLADIIRFRMLMIAAGYEDRHPGSHTVGYILEGTYEVKIDDGPVRTLKAGEVFYEYPNALHAISRNPSSTEKLKYLIIQVSDPTKPATVQEPTHAHP
jgi:mannose-6-phosphate isomerase-like protein (cupin superfamily)